MRLSGQKSLKGEPAKVKLKLPSVLSRPIAGQSLPSSGHPGVHTLSESFHPRLALVGLHAVLVTPPSWNTLLPSEGTWSPLRHPSQLPSRGSPYKPLALCSHQPEALLLGRCEVHSSLLLLSLGPADGAACSGMPSTLLFSSHIPQDGQRRGFQQAS